MKRYWGVGGCALVAIIVCAMLLSQRGEHRYAFHASGSSPTSVPAGPTCTPTPEPIVPAGFAEGRPGYARNLQTIDACIQGVWPHDGLGNPMPADQAPYVDVAVELFEHGTLKQVKDFPRSHIVLYSSERPAVPTIINRGWTTTPPEMTTYQVGDTNYCRYVFRDIPVEPDKRERYRFTVRLIYPGSSARPWPDEPAFSYRTTAWTYTTSDCAVP